MANPTTMIGEFYIFKKEGCKNTWKEIYSGVRKLFDITERVEYGLKPCKFLYEEFPKSEDVRITGKFLFMGTGRWYSDSFEEWIKYKKDGSEPYAIKISEYMKDNILDNVRIIFTYDEEEGGAGYYLTGNKLIIEIKKDSLTTTLEETEPEKNFERSDLRFKNGWIEDHFEFFTEEDLDFADPITFECDKIDNSFGEQCVKSSYDIVDNVEDKEFLTTLIKTYEDKENKSEDDMIFGEFLKLYLNEGFKNEDINGFVYRLTDNKVNSIRELMKLREEK